MKIVVLKKRSLIIVSILIIICVLIFGIPELQKILVDNICVKKYSEYVEKYSELYDVDENLIYAVIKAESNFDPLAKSNKGATGLMQIMEETAKDVVKKTDLDISTNNIGNSLIDVDVNINLGTKYLSILLNRYQNKEVAVAAYNAGIGTVDTWIEKGVIKADGSDIENVPYKETNSYVRKIIRDYKMRQVFGG